MKIVNITKNKNNYIITFDNKESLILDEELFTDYYFYVEKEIEIEEFKKIKKESNLIKEKNILSIYYLKKVIIKIK